MEDVAWYWHPEKGFEVLTSSSTLLSEYGKDQRGLFSFYKLVINESGTIAGSFLVGQTGNPKINECAWFWWSKDRGICLSPQPAGHEILQDIDDKGNVLINKTNKSCYITNIYNQNEIKYINYPPIPEIRRQIADWVKLNIKTEKGRKNQLKYGHWVINAKKIQDNLSINGEARVQFYYPDGDLFKERYTAHFKFEISDQLDSLYIQKIEKFRGTWELIYERSNA